MAAAAEARCSSSSKKRVDFFYDAICRYRGIWNIELRLRPVLLAGIMKETGSLQAMRFITAVDLTQPQFVESVSRELWMRVWSRDEDITQPANILAAAGKAGLPSDQAQKLLEMSSTPEVKNRLKATTDEVIFNLSIKPVALD
ncbi:hypothetical protein JD844_009872 [Phrynosoma platyrhinos]|uniref:DSBA-like thioredoxin domain-containing protein n=1 Tax=Phrynosoma platyrhinos TaxID=52577 RepID=A0ABQ7TFM2_PHRPL|nr:hypothetical protein JD844_009872 [Phrynosoma platyrhinos]